MANNHDIVYMAPPPAGRPRFDGSPTRQFAMGLVSIVTTAIAFAVVALRVLTRRYIVKMPMRVDDCEFCWSRCRLHCWLSLLPDFAVAAVIASILLVVSNAIRTPPAFDFTSVALANTVGTERDVGIGLHSKGLSEPQDDNLLRRFN